MLLYSTQPVRPVSAWAGKRLTFDQIPGPPWRGAHSPDLDLGHTLLVEQHKFPGDVIERDVGQVHLALKHLGERREARGPDEDHVTHVAQPDHLTCGNQSGASNPTHPPASRREDSIPTVPDDCSARNTLQVGLDEVMCLQQGIPVSNHYQQPLYVGSRERGHTPGLRKPLALPTSHAPLMRRSCAGFPSASTVGICST